MNVQSKPLVIGLLAGWFFLLLTLCVVATCGSCAAVQRSSLRPLARQGGSAVMIESFCMLTDPFASGEISFTGGHGSGVLIDARHVLTAEHVVACTYLSDLHVTLNDGRRIKPRVVGTWPEHDIALLELPVDVLGIDYAMLAPPPKVDDVVCTSVAWPKRGGACGQIDSNDGSTRWDLRYSAPIVPGNSGGGLYDASGHLVGIVTGYNTVLMNPYSIATSLWQLRTKVMP